RRPDLRITDIEVLPLSYVDPAGDLWHCGAYQVWKTDGAITRIYTDQGLVGIGEGSPYEGPDYIKEYTEGVIRPLLLGQNPFDVELLTNRGNDSRHGRAPWAGVDNACWDLIGKALGKPVYELLAVDHEPTPEIRIYASAGVQHEWYADGERFLIEEALRYQEEGYDAFKFRCGTDWHAAGMTFEKYIPILRRLREAVGPDFRLMHEGVGTQGGSLEAIITDLAPALEELGFYWFEEAFGGTDLKHLDLILRLKEALPTVKVSGGERFLERFEAQEWLDRRALDIVQTDCNVTGITENWHIARMAHLRGVTSIPHNWHGGGTTMANAHFVAGIPNGEYCELNQTHNPLKEGIFKEPLVVERGRLRLPDRPGFGMDLVDDVEKRFPYVPGSYSKPNPRLSSAS
ncbi:MAG: mandelate racemase/muconate lactonizing enzyme family protein, partial [Gemmatimonadota bacterium]